MSDGLRNRLREQLVLAVVCGFLFCYGLAAFGLVGADEPRYAQIAREMLDRGDPVTPVFHGHVWLEKPVLYYWLGAASYRVFGVSDWAARLPCALLALGMVAGVYLYARRFRPGSEADAALITASSAGILAFARGVSTDMPLTASLTLALLAWLAFLETGERRWLLFFYFASGAGMLAKGPIAPALAGLIIVVFAAIRREPRLILRTLWVPGVLLFCAVVLPWYVAVQLRNPQFFREFFLEHNLARFSTDVYRHQQPFWFFVPVLLLFLLPWTACALAAAVDVVRGWHKQGSALPGSADGYRVFLLLWAVLPVIFFSISQSKLPGYILPAIPAWTLLTADYLHRRRTERREVSGWLFSLHAALLAGLAVAVGLAPYRMLQQDPSRQALAIIIAVALALFAAVLITLRRRGPALLRFATLAPVLVLVGFILRADAPTIDATQSARPVAQELARLGFARSPIAVVRVSRSLEYGLGFYRSQEIANYERGEIPQVGHLLVQGHSTEMYAPGNVTEIGSFPPQRLEYVWVSPLTSHPLTVTPLTENPRP